MPRVRTLAMMMQSMSQFRHYIDTKDLDSIHNEDAIITAAVEQQLENPSGIVPTRLASFRGALTNLAQGVSQLHQAGDLHQHGNAERALRQVTKAFKTVESCFSESAVAAATELASRYTCPMHLEVVGKQGDTCPKCGMKLDQMIRILPSSMASQSGSSHLIHASVRTDGPLTVGKPVTAYLELRKPDGFPVTLSDLIETHTRKIHLLIIDSSLTDYHHEHPQPTDKFGDYVLHFTPHKPGSYRVWADLRPYPIGLQEYDTADIPAATQGLPLTDRTLNREATVDGLHYRLSIAEDEIKVGRPAHARLRVTTPDGKGFTQLEPIMATFAHIVGFSEDYKTVLHMHPKGPPVLDPNARGGPELEFQIYALKPGFVRLFAQVQIDGRSHFAPFGINVVP